MTVAVTEPSCFPRAAEKGWFRQDVWTVGKSVRGGREGRLLVRRSTSEPPDNTNSFRQCAAAVAAADKEWAIEVQARSAGRYWPAGTVVSGESGGGETGAQRLSVLAQGRRRLNSPRRRRQRRDSRGFVDGRAFYDPHAPHVRGIGATQPGPTFFRERDQRKPFGGERGGKWGREGERVCMPYLRVCCCTNGYFPRWEPPAG